ncbi:uncharacterized protein LOC142224979 [Haematobia irritans]|uniref:uncharacterized protein LOC142224979 n=1 Tax=Haematobia irritans TaxID=7368 RepID=UPI003F504CBF
MRNLDMVSDSPSELCRQDHFSLLRDKVLERMKISYDKNVKTYNLRAKDRVFEKGQLVTRRNFAQSNMAKHFNAKLSPVGIRARVLEKIGNCNYKLQDCDSGNVSVYHIKDIW